MDIYPARAPAAALKKPRRVRSAPGTAWCNAFSWATSYGGYCAARPSLAHALGNRRNGSSADVARGRHQRTRLKYTIAGADATSGRLIVSGFSNPQYTVGKTRVNRQLPRTSFPHL